MSRNLFVEGRTSDVLPKGNCGNDSVGTGSSHIDNVYGHFDFDLDDRAAYRFKR